MPAETLSNKTIILNLLDQGGPVCFRAGGSSMHPVIRDGESVQIRQAHPGDLRRGAILFISFKNRIMLHRLIAIKSTGNELLLAGDGFLSGIDCVNSSDVAGIATSVQRAGRTIPLDTTGRRLRGMLRYRLLRPVRRLIWSLYSNHAGTPAN